MAQTGQDKSQAQTPETVLDAMRQLDPASAVPTATISQTRAFLEAAEKTTGSFGKQGSRDPGNYYQSYMDQSQDARQWVLALSHAGSTYAQITPTDEQKAAAASVLAAHDIKDKSGNRAEGLARYAIARASLSDKELQQAAIQAPEPVAAAVTAPAPRPEPVRAPRPEPAAARPETPAAPKEPPKSQYETLLAAAQGGDQAAQVEVAKRLHSGLGVAQDLNAAHEWADKARQGPDDRLRNQAEFHIRRIDDKMQKAGMTHAHADGSPSTPPPSATEKLLAAREEQRAQLLTAAQAGDQSAQLELATQLSRGTDLKGAHDWANKALAGQDRVLSDRAEFLLRRVDRKMNEAGMTHDQPHNEPGAPNGGRQSPNLPSGKVSQLGNDPLNEQIRALEQATGVTLTRNGGTQPPATEVAQQDRVVPQGPDGPR